MRYAVCLESKCKSKILAAAASYDLIVVDAQDFTGPEIKALKSGGAKVLSYLNVGAVESDRSYFAAAKRDGLLLGPYDNWPGEYWVAAQSPKWKSVILGLATTIKAKGVDGFWCDNLDILYTAEEEYKWSAAKLTELYTNLQAILAGLHKEGYVMLNGADVFVTRAIKAKEAGGFDGVNQETVVTCIKDYNAPGKFGRQSADEREYFTDYLQNVRMAEKDVCLLEYATDAAITKEAQAFAQSKGYSLCISGSIELGGDIENPDAGKLDELTLAIESSKVILGKYGSGETRKKNLKKAGYTTKEREQIQTEVDRVWGHDDLIVFNMAAATIADAFGKRKTREKNLGKWASKVQGKINEIYNLRGRTTAQAALLVWQGKFGKGTVRKRLLEFCGYNAAKVQAEVDKGTGKTAGEPDTKYRIYAPRFWDNNPEKYGDVTCFIEYASDGKTPAFVVVVDTGMDGTNTIKKLQQAGVEKIDILIISHDHSDHHGLTKKILSAFEVGKVLLPPQDGIEKYQPGHVKRMKELAAYCRAHDVPADFYIVGDRITCGSMAFDVLFQADAEKLTEKEDHHFINNLSPVIKATCGKWTILLCGDLQKDGINQLLSKGINIACDIFKILWHGDFGAITEALVAALGAVLAYCQYHSKESKGNGRTKTYDLLRNAGALVVRSYEDGEIYMDIEGKTLTVTTSNGVKKTFRK